MLAIGNVTGWKRKMGRTFSAKLRVPSQFLKCFFTPKLLAR